MKKTRHQLRKQRLVSLIIMIITLAATWLTAQFGVIILTAFFACLSMYAGISAGYAQYKLQTFKF